MTQTAADPATELRAFMRAFKRRLREQADTGDLTMSQIAVVLRLEQGGAQTVSDLARAESVRSQSMGATVAALQALGFVSGAPDPADGRQTLIDLTPKTRDWIATGRAARQDWLTRAIDGELAPAEQAVLLAVLPLLRRIADA